MYAETMLEATAMMLLVCVQGQSLKLSEVLEAGVAFYICKRQ